MIDDTILREYDVRGTVGENLTEQDVYLIARAFGSFVARSGGKTVCTTYDGRESSVPFSVSLNKGLMDCGLNVVDSGQGSTPLHYFAVMDMDADAGMMITGSHNPPEYNGIKMTLKGGIPFFGKSIKDLAPVIDAEDFVDGEGSIEKQDFKEEYIKRLLKDLQLDKDLTVVWDNGNGAGGEILQELVKQIPGEHKVLYGEVDGTFPNHHPDPSASANLVDLQKAVIEVGADVGFAFDGDADRVGVVTEKGEIISNDILLAILAKEELKKEPKGRVVGDVKCSKVFFDKIAEYGGEPVMSATGGSNVKGKMNEVDAVLAGEISGHITFNRGFYGQDDGMYAAIKMLNVLNNEDKRLSEVLAEYPKTDVTEETRVEVPEEDKFRIVEEVEKAFKAMPEFDIIDIDGIRATNEDGIVMFRASNTQNVLSIRLESLTGKDGLIRIVDLLIEELKKVGVEITRKTFGV